MLLSFLQFLRRLGIKDSEGDRFFPHLDGLRLGCLLGSFWSCVCYMVPTQLIVAQHRVLSFALSFFQDPLLFSRVPFLFLSILVLNSTSL